MSVGIKKIFRSKKDRMIAGVCGGIGEFFKVDSTLIRAVFVLATLLSAGVAIIFYIVLAIITPEEGEDEGTVSGSEMVNGDVVDEENKN